MPTSATIGTGCKLSVDPADGTSWTDIAEITSITLSLGAKEVEVTELLSGGDERYLVGTVGYSMTFAGHWAPDIHDLNTIKLIRNSDARTTSNWRITWNDPTSAATAIFSGFVTSLDISVGGPAVANTISGTVRIADASDMAYANMATV